MEGSEFDEFEFFRAVDLTGTRALLIGRQAEISCCIVIMKKVVT